MKKLKPIDLFGIRFCLAGFLFIGFSSAALILWGQKPDQDPNCPPVSLLEPLIGVLGPAFVSAIYFCSGSTLHWLFRKKDALRIVVSDVLLWLAAFGYLIFLLRF